MSQYLNTLGYVFRHTTCYSVCNIVVVDSYVYFQTDSEIQTKLRQTEEDNRKLREEIENLKVSLNYQARDKQSMQNREISKLKEQVEAKIRSVETENRLLNDKLNDADKTINNFKQDVRDLTDKYRKAESIARQEKCAKEENQKLLKVKADKVEEIKQVMAEQSEVIQAKSEEMRKDKNQLLQLRKELDETKSR